jgi:formylglycine-generating enzyme required for sulfatase activity
LSGTKAGPGVLLILLLSLAAMGRAADEPGNRHALIIGNGDYRRIDRLPNTVNDASAIAAKLTALGYAVDLQLNAGLPEMTRAIAGWVRRLSLDRSHEGFFWYAGHGVQVGGENYLLPVDIEADDEAGIIYGSYPLGRLLLSLEQTARNKLNVVVLDACRDNPFRNLPGGSRGLSRGFVTVEHPPQDIFIMFSTAPGTVAADGDGGGNSPFAEAFLRYMDSGEILPVMAGLVARETMRITGGKQRPYQNGSIVSDLYYSLLPPGARAGGAAEAAPRPAAAAGTLRLAEHIQPVMAAIAAGKFSMGSPSMEYDRVEFQEYRHEVALSDFYLAEREVTVGEFRRFVEDTGFRTSAEKAGGADYYNEASGEWETAEGYSWRRPGFTQDDDHPVVNVSWFDAVEYCNWLSAREGLDPVYRVSGGQARWDRSANGYRLPTEAEWEYACRAGTAGPFSTGERISTAQANYDGSRPYFNNGRGLFRKRTMPAASFPPNPWGLYDMHGNVWEWCWDIYGLFYHSGPEGVTPPPALSRDPLGAETGAYRVNRGGGWASPGKSLRSAARSGDYPETANSGVGFRVARNRALSGWALHQTFE